MKQKLLSCLKLVFINLLFLLNQYSYAQTSNLWVVLNPNAGGLDQVDEDISINNGFVNQNYSSGNITCSQSSNGDDLVYSIAYIGDDFDNNGINDQVSFNLRIKGYVGATYNYNTEPNMSSVTDYGTQSDITLIGNTWGVSGDFDIDAGESLVYNIENLTVNGINLDFTHSIGFSVVNLIEPNGGRDHTMIFGFGNNLKSFEMDYNQSISPLSTDSSFSVTGAGSPTTITRDFAISSLTFYIEIKGPNDTIWDVTDYSTFEKGPSLYHDYPVQTEPKTTLPKFSWNKIPRWVAVRNKNAFSEDDVTSIANNYQLVMLEKANQQGFEYIEDGIENAATRIKALNPNLTTLFYYNTYINYFNYEANIEYNTNATNWSTYENGEIYLFKDLYYWYNHDIEDMRNWWIDTCVDMANLDVIDGVFVDKIINPDNNGDLYDVNGNPINNYVSMLSDLNDKLPSNKLLVGNTLRNERSGGVRALMEIMDGSYLERWDFPSKNQSDANAIALSIQLMREALHKGKMINLQTNPSYSTEEEEPTDNDELLAYAKEHVKFPLAVFLIIVEEHAYFSYTTGVNAASSSSDLWNTSFIDEFHYFLGEPLGDPTKNGYVYERSFENLDLWVNIETKETIYNWKDETILSLDDTSDGFYETITLYPNPVNNTFSLSKKIKSATVFNILGKEIMSFSKNQNQYDISNLKSGVFIVKLTFENDKNKNIRFVKK
ncbi:putative glycoside hydrolase [Flavivirga jejuensis]|uniref:Glycoside hydrolase n=1 Tax=Flavivirga jejuensis TaxID=870487 RepID=A0ABT8WKX3_9FLAO|nr:putative glycoside hydrolase [Flavivirga jejuensis]MDO5973805.1 putative glycoside hydrolase [Flavivirga jejuensis]